MTSKQEQFYKQQIAELEMQVAELRKANETLVQKNGELSEQVVKLTDQIAKLSKNSSNSSKPSSSDVVKPPRKRRNKTVRKIGAQLGHTRYDQTPFSVSEIDDFYEHTLDVCPDCGGVLKLVKRRTRVVQVVQQVEIVEDPTHVEQHTSFCYWCEHCRKLHYAPLPPEIEKAQLIGPRLTALVAYMKGPCHCSFFPLFASSCVRWWA